MNRWEKCKLCGGPDLRPLYHLPRVNVRVVECRACGFAFADALYDESVAADLYSRELTREGEYDRYEPLKEARASERVGEIAALRAGRAGEAPLGGLAVLDVGAGGGCFLDVIRRAGAEVRGIELSGSARDFARDRYGIELDARPLDDSAWGEGSADIVTLWDVIEHVQDPARLVARAARILRPGGILALTTPGRDTAMHAAAVWLFRATLGRADVLLGHRYNLLHLQVFRTCDLERLLAAHGLSTVRMRKLRDLTYPPTWYFREALGRKHGGEAMALLSGIALALLPLRNKILAYAVRQKAGA